jgi:Ni,Fe-hydrogenase III small subunit
MKRTGFPLLLTTIILAILLVLSSLPGCATKVSTTTTKATESATPQPIKIYTIGSCAELTGFLDAYNTVTVNEAQMAVAIVNELGGVMVGGQTIILNSSLKMGKARWTGLLPPRIN